jgi:nucleoside-diphosphate-sugar epimerase
MKAVVTGGAGFIGSHLVDLLLDKGYEVIIIDNFCTGSLNNINQSSNRVSIINHDIRIPLPTNVFDKCSIVFHLAALADIVPSIEKPIAYMNTNVQGTVRVLEGSRLAKVKKFVYAASSSCYGLAKTPTLRADKGRSGLRPNHLACCRNNPVELCGGRAGIVWGAWTPRLAKRRGRHHNHVRFREWPNICGENSGRTSFSSRGFGLPPWNTD